MKRKYLKYITLLPLIVLASCGSDESIETKESYKNEEIYSLLTRFYEGYHVEGTLTQLNEFSGDYEINTNIDTSEIKRDYGYLVKDEKTLKAINVYSGDSYNTYYRNSETGRVTGDFLNYQNEVISETISLGLSSPYYDNKYLDPFDFITYKDFDSSLNLDIKKAGFILEQYFGVISYVTSAKFNYDGDKVIADFDIIDRTCAFESDDDTGEYVIKSSLKLEFTFDVTFETLTSSTNENSDLAFAFENNGSNYTLILESSSATTNVGFYVTSSGILEVQDYGANKLTVGDIYYKRSGSSYIKYIYNPGTVLTYENAGSVELSEFLCDFTSISPAIFSSLTSSTYVLLNAARMYVPYYLTPVDYRLNEDDGESGSITLNLNKQIESVNLTYYYGGEYITYNQTFINRGETSFPSYFDPTNSDLL